MKILLVDDFAPIRQLMLLVLAGHEEIAEVQEAADGFIALELCLSFQPDLVLLDYWMPGIDGEETAARIKAMHPDARIVAYSAVLEALPAWADALMIKDSVPDPDQLVQLARGS